jgi:hypothetical protein
MAQALPRGIRYDNAPTQSLPCKSKIWRFQPQVTTTGFVQQQTQIIFNINTDDFIDPYTCYLAFQIDVSSSPHYLDNGSTAQTPAALWQLDKCGHSLVSMMYITAKGQTEIERIMEYDTLGGILQDMSYSEWDTHQRFQEGVGGQQDCSSAKAGMGGYFTAGFTSGGNPMGLGRNGFIPGKNNDFFECLSNGGSYPYSYLPNHQSLTSLPSIPCGNHIKYDFGKCPQTKLVRGVNAYQSWIQAGFTATNWEAYIGTTATAWQILGFDADATSNFSNGSAEVILSGQIGQNAIDQGTPTAQLTPFNAWINTPLLSGIFGILVPPEHYKLVPTGAFGDLQFYFTLSPYAFFSNVNSADPTYRYYKLSKIELVCELVRFEQNVNEAIYGALDGGAIYWNTSSYWLGPVFNLVSGQLPSSIQLNLGFNSLRTLIWCYIANDYQSTSGARKQFRLSMNLTSAQINIGTEKYPELPITGNAGCLYNTKNGTCADFYQHLLRAFDKLFIANDAYSVGMANFAINQRDWSYYPGYTGINTEFTTPTAGNTLNQFNYRCERSVVGKAAYAIDLCSLNHEYGWRTGVNTISKLPFQLDLYSDTSVPYPGSATMYTWCKYDLTLVITRDAVQIIGRS